jgi:hypothetical protein
MQSSSTYDVPSDFEVLVAIVSRLCVRFLDLEPVFPHADPYVVWESVLRLAKAGRVGVVLVAGGPLVDCKLAVPGYFEERGAIIGRRVNFELPIRR